MRWFRPKWVIRQLFKVFFLTILSILILVAVITYFLSAIPSIHVSQLNESKYSAIKLISFDKAPHRHVVLPSRATPSNTNLKLKSDKSKTTKRCSMYNCFDVYRCGKTGLDSLSVYVYPFEKILINGKLLQNSISREFYEFIEAIVKSPYYVHDPNKACVFVPTIDLLNLNSIYSTSISVSDILGALTSLEFWGENGQNHLLLTMHPGHSPFLSLPTEAVIASAGFPVNFYRMGYHIPVVSYNPLLRSHSIRNSSSNNFIKKRRKVLAISAQGALEDILEDDDIFVLDFCSHDRSNYTIRCIGNEVLNYPEILLKTDFCLVLKDLSNPVLWDVMSVGCIPVIIADSQRLPFDEVIDWKRNAILLYENHLTEISSILRSVSDDRKRRLKSQVLFTFKKYFQNMHLITNTILEVIKERVFPHSALTGIEWNDNPENAIKKSPIFNPVNPPKGPGFTAVILAYERVQSLFQVIERVSLVPSLSKILVIWNNQVRKPPPFLAWPKVAKPLRIIQTKANKMSNRFFPYDEIETEAVFSLDDDIIMLTVDEIEFGFETWREFPDRIVGFPSRTHVWDNSTKRWKYESEWTNEISMVLTGAAFYHKYWHHAYMNILPRDIREWVDSKMNCEDIALNFLVSYETGKAPIKVAPRKKFKCPTCSNNEMLSADTSHMVERTDCINKFTQVYGDMPLIPVEFRADPVLFKVDNLPNKLKKFNDIGSL